MWIVASIMKHEMRVVSCFQWLFYRTLANSVGLKSLFVRIPTAINVTRV